MLGARSLAAPGALIVLLAILACVDGPRAAATSYASSAPASGYVACDAADVASITAGFATGGRRDVTTAAEADALAASAAAAMAAGHCDAVTSIGESHLAYAAGLYDHHTEIESELWHGRLDEDRLAAFARGVGADLARSMPACPLIVGAARATSGTDTVVALVAAARCATLTTSLPHVLSVGSTLDLHGAVPSTLVPTEVVLNMPDGRTSSDDLAPDASTAAHPFAWRHSFAVPGRYVLELVVRDAHTGPTPVLKAELLVGIEAPPIATVCRATSLETPADAITRTLALVNASRRALGLTPLILDPNLATAAQGHSDDMAHAHYFGHWSPSGTTPQMRAAASGAAVSRVGENVASGRDAQEMHDSLMESPGHRASIVDPLFTHIGIGATIEGEEIDLTELFGTISPPLDVARDRPTVVAAIGAALGAPIATDPRLEAAAQAAADRFFTTDAPSELDVRQDALRRAAGVSTVREEAVTWRLGSLTELPELAAFHAGFDHFGIGLAQGHRADGPPSEYVAVVLAAQLHADAIDTAALERSVLDALNQERTSHGAPPLTVDETLSAASRRLAVRWLAGETSAVLYQSANDQRPALGLEHAGLRYQCGSVRTAADALRWSTPLDASVRRIGIGIAQGAHDGVDGAIAMFVLGVTE
jgi:uncharacterized protein YkwD